MKSIDNKMNVLIFSPFQGVEFHSYPEAAFANVLEEAKHTVKYLMCGGMLKKFCIVHSSYGLNESSTQVEKERVCSMCTTNRNVLQRRFDNSSLLDDFYDSKKWDDEIIRFVDATTPRNISSLSFNGYPVGRIAAYEFILHHKLFDLQTISSPQLNYYKGYLSSTLKALVSFEAYLAKNQIDRILLYNAAYSINNSIRYVANRQQIPVAFMHASYNLAYFSEAIYVSWKQTIEFDKETINFYEKNYSNIDLDYENYKIPLSHFAKQLGAESVFTYSSSRNRRLDLLATSLKIDFKKYKKIILLSMSSSDEAFAADFALMNDGYLSSAFRLFPSQVDWVQKVIKFFVNKPDFKLIIRPHPREYPNKREGVVAPRVAVYDQLFSGLPDNISIDYPHLRNSIYDLFEIIDLHLVSQSTVGCEGALLGILGLGCVRGLGNYPIQFINPVPDTVGLYFDRLKELLDTPRDHCLKTARRAFEWYLFLHRHPAIFFETNNFWTKNRSHRLISRLSRKAKEKLGLPRYSFQRYQNSLKISDTEKRKFLNFFEGSRELVELNFDNNEVRQKSKTDSLKILHSYFKELFRLYFSFDLNPYDRFSYESSDRCGRSILPHECIFVESEELFNFGFQKKPHNSCLVKLPSSSKGGRALARFIFETFQALETLR